MSICFGFECVAAYIYEKKINAIISADDEMIMITVANGDDDKDLKALVLDHHDDEYHTQLRVLRGPYFLFSVGLL